jgi:ABC-type branched-subunit amino acid transport system permease subunit
MQQQSWQSTVIALGFIVFAGFALWVAADHDFSAIWAGAGTIVGVLTGAVPSYFFKQQSDKFQQQSDKATAKANALAGITNPTEYQTLMETHPELH